MKNFILCFFCFLVALVLGYYWGKEAGYRKAYQETIPALLQGTYPAIDDAAPAEDVAIVEEAAVEEVVKPTVSKTETAASFDPKAVTMVNFKQAWADSPTIALKNNTDKDITHVKFRIVYYDMKGNQIDYQDVEKSVAIAAGLSKTIEYRMSLSTSDYYYCKTTGYKGMDTQPYNIKFQLLSYK